MTLLSRFKKMVGGQKKGRLVEDWKFDSKSPISAGPKICDFEGKGKKNLIFGTDDGKVYCVGSKGEKKWIFNVQEAVDKVEAMFYDQETANSIQAEPNIYDLNGDGKKEIVVGSEMGVVYAITPEGKNLWKFKADGSVRGSVFIHDLDGNGRPEIVFGCGDENLYILNAQGELVEKHEIGCSIKSTPNALKENIVFGCDNGHVHCITLTGKELWKYHTDDKIIAQPAVGNLYGDKKNYVVIGSFDQHLHCVDENGEEIWKYRTGGAIYSRAILRDINKDKKLEVIFGSCDNNIYAVDSNGDKLWSYEADFWIVAPLIVEDIDGDGELEVVAGSYDHNLYVLDARGNYALDYVPGLSGVVQQPGSYADVMTSEPGDLTGKKLWQYQADGVIVGCAYSHDNDNIIINTKKGIINVLKHEKR